jgi:hypothetical protein
MSAYCTKIQVVQFGSAVRLNRTPNFLPFYFTLDVDAERWL